MVTQTKSQQEKTKAETTQTKASKAKTTQSKTAQTKTAAKTSKAKAAAKPDQTETETAKAEPTAKATQAKTSKARTNKASEEKKKPVTVFSIDATQSLLADLLALVDPAVQANPAKLILGYLKIDTLKDACRITAVETGYAIAVTADCETTQMGTGLLPTQLAAVIKAIPPSEHLALVGSSVEGEDHATQVTLTSMSGTTSTTPISLSPETFPTAELSETKFEHCLPAEKLKLLLQAVLGSVGPKDKGALHAVNMLFEGDTLTCQSTDGHQISIAKVEASEMGRSRRKSSQSQPKTVNCLLPPETVKALLKLLGQASKESEVEFTLNENGSKAGFKIKTDKADVFMNCQCMDDSYPNVDQVVQAYSYGTSALVDRTSLIGMAQILKTVKSKAPVAKFVLEGTSLNASMEGDELSGTQAVKASLNMPETEFRAALNLNLLINLAQSMQGEQLLLEFGHSESLIRISPTSQELDGMQTIGYMMPVKIEAPDGSK